VPLTAATMHWFIDHYTPDAADRLDWRASPLQAASLAGLPSALVLTVAHDPLCDEGRAYARRLDADGVRVATLHLNDQTHGLLSQGKLVPAANTVADYVFGTIGRELHRPTLSSP
jgi:acetyl esterase